MSYVSVNNIFRKIDRDTGLDVDELDVVEWAGEAMQGIGAVNALEECVAFIEVKNHQINVPSGMHGIIQIAKFNGWDTSMSTDGSVLCPANVVEELSTENEEEGPYVPVALDCSGTPINDYELAYYRPYYDLTSDYFGWSNSNFFRQWSPVRLANSSFFGAVVYEDYKGLYENYGTSGYEEYTMINKCQAIRFSFKEGFVALAHTRQVVDEDGWPMIPDTYAYRTAITKYVTLKMKEKEWLNGRQGVEKIVMKLEADWQWYCKQAGNEAMMPKGVDGMENILRQSLQVLPRQHRYNSFFGNLAKGESRKFNDPDHRNTSRTYARGYAV